MFYLLRFTLAFIVNWCIPERVERWVDEHVVCINVCLVNTRSEGEVTVGADGTPIIKMKYLDEAHDFDLMRDGINMSEELRKSDDVVGLKDFVEILPGPVYRKMLSMDSYIDHFVTSFYHLHGSCAIGSVVDGETCRVLGTNNLLVVDASVFPECVDAPLARTCVALGEIVGELAGKGKGRVTTTKKAGEVGKEKVA